MYNQSNSKNPGANPPPLENSDSVLIDTHTPTPPEPNRERIIAHVAEVKFINNRYATPVTIEFGSSDSESTMNIPVKHRKIFAAITLLDPSATINIGEKTLSIQKSSLWTQNTLSHSPSSQIRKPDFLNFLCNMR